MNGDGPDKDLFLLDQNILRLSHDVPFKHRRYHVCGVGHPPKEAKLEQRNVIWESTTRLPPTFPDEKATSLVGRALGEQAWKRVALVCDAGLGKTTNMEWLQAHLSERGSRVLPLLLRLDNPYAQELLADEHARPLSLLHHLATEIERIAKSGDITHQEQHLRKMLAQGRITLLIDGLDHAISRMAHLPQKLAKLLDTTWQNCAVWISGRPNAFNQAWEGLFDNAPWTFLRVEGLDVPEIRFYLREQVEPDENDRTGLEWYYHLPEEGRELLAIPRFLHLVAGVLRDEVAAAKQRGDNPLAAVEQLDLRTRADVYRLAYFEPGVFVPPAMRVENQNQLRNRRGLIAQGLEVQHVFSDGTWQYLGLEKGEEPTENNHAGRIKYAADLLSAIAFEMYANPDKYRPKNANRDKAPVQPNTAGVADIHMRAFQNAVRGRLSAANLYLDGGIIGNDFEILGDNNRTVDWLIFNELGDKGLAWHDPTVQAFFAAYWAMNYATPKELKTMARWRVVRNKENERLAGFEEFWQFAAEMPELLIHDVEMDNWFITFGPSYTPPAELPNDDEDLVQWHRKMIYHSYLRMEQRLQQDKNEALRKRASKVLDGWRGLWLELKAGGGTKEQQEVLATMIFRNCPPSMKEESFLMGSPPDESDRYPDENQRRVTVKPFALQDFQATNAQYELFDPKHRREQKISDQDGQPVVNVTFWDSWCFAKWTGNRLPREEEWEYACRAGTTTPFSFGRELNGAQANCDGNYPYGTDQKGPYLERTVAKGEAPEKTGYEANGWGLWHLHGNVWEWCDSRDEPGASARVLRGGRWDFIAWLCRSAYRLWYEPGERINYYGFRLAAVPADGAKQDKRSVGDEAASIVERSVTEPRRSRRSGAAG